MSTLQVQTALIIVGVLFFLLPTVAWLVLARQRSAQVALWCGGGFVMGFCLVLAGTQGDQVIEEMVLFALGVGMLVANFMRIQSLRMDLGRALRLHWLALATVGVVIVVKMIDVLELGSVLRAQFFSLVMAVQILYLAALAWRIGKNEKSHNARMLAAGYLLVGLAMLFRVISLSGMSESTPFTDEGLAVQMIAMATLLSSVVGHLSYVGLALDRAKRAELQANTDRVRQEENHRLGEQIAQLDRQRNLGELSASLGHELNQPLTAILTSAQVAKRALDGNTLDAKIHAELLERIVTNTKRASQIIDRIRSYIRPSETLQVKSDLHQIVMEVAALVADEAHRCQVIIQVVHPQNPVKVLCDPLQISQVVLNVLRNSMDALMSVVHREIEVTYSDVNGLATLRIRDTGPGMASEILASVGTPFFTTKPTGLGLGISISRSIATQHGGTLTLRNTDARHGKGAIVELVLPALQE